MLLKEIDIENYIETLISCCQQRTFKKYEILITGRYFVSKAEVRLMIHLLTIVAISARAPSPLKRSSSVASASRPRKMMFSNFRLNSDAVPNNPGFTKLTRLKL